MNALKIQNLTKTYPGFCLDDLSLTLPSGCILGLIGENGAGKSTTIKLILDMLRRDSGTVTILGKDNRDNLRLTKENVGVVLDEVGIPECLTAMQVGKIMALTFRQWDQSRYEAYLERLSIPEKKPFKEFSRGMKMKLGIAIAMSHHPKLLILDEATSGLDPVVRDEVVEMFRDFTREENHSILISSHIVSDLEKLCDYIAFLHQGRLLFCEEKDRLLEEYGIFSDTTAQLECLLPEAIVAREPNGYGGVRALVRRELAPVGWQLEPASVEDIILFLVKGAKQA